MVQCFAGDLAGLGCWVVWLRESGAGLKDLKIRAPLPTSKAGLGFRVPNSENGVFLGFVRAEA